MNDLSFVFWFALQPQPKTYRASRLCFSGRTRAASQTQLTSDSECSTTALPLLPLFSAPAPHIVCGTSPCNDSHPTLYRYIDENSLTVFMRGLPYAFMDEGDWRFDPSTITWGEIAPLFEAFNTTRPGPNGEASEVWQLILDER